MKSARSLLALPAVLAACASGRFQPAGDDIEDPVDAAPAVDTGTTDADPAPSDAPSPDAPPSAAAGLLLSE
ncbi:MAG: hypothetical protein F9K40_22005, partial [Kofleriaceae bacterium]